VSTNPVIGASRAAALEARAHRSAGLSRLREFIERESVFSWLILTPPLLFLLAFLGYPFFYGVYLSFFRREVAGSPSFVGLGNFVTLANDPIFWQSVGNTIKFTAAATLLKATGGLGMALVMNQNFRMKAITRSLLLLPFIVPTVLSTVAWQWIFDPGMGLFNRLLVESGLAKTGPSWLGNPTMAMISIIMVNTWRGLPFFGISILAGLQTIPVELHESATIDGASTWGRFRYVTLPSLLPVIFIVTTFSIILTFFDFQLVYVLTGGGPANSTHLMATYAYSLSVGVGQMGLGSAVALSMVPVLGLLLVLLTFYVRKE
jgi:multiple sugar transport system permease protein